MKKIYKYQLQLEQLQFLDLPEGYKILNFQVQNNIPTIWVLIDDYVNEQESITIRLFGTGWDIPEDYEGEYIGTAQVDDLVWHYFKDKKQ